MKKVLIVQEGQGKGEIAKAYQEEIGVYKRVLDRAAEVKVVETAEEAERMVERHEADILIFITSRMRRKAEELAKKFPRVWVYVFTAEIPGGEVRWMDKFWIKDFAILRNLVLFG